MKKARGEFHGSSRLFCMMTMTMMWIFLVLVASGYVGATDDEGCSRDTTEVCELGEITTYISKTISETNSISCKIVLESLQCVIRVEEKCHFDNDFLNFAKQSLPVIQEKCSEILPELPSAHTDTSQAVGGEVDCSVPTDVACKLLDLHDVRGSLYERCRILLTKAECMIRVEEKCHSNEYILQLAKRQLPQLKRVCGREREGVSGIMTGSGLAERGNILATSTQCIRNVLNVERRGYCAALPCKFKLAKYAEVLLEKGIIAEVDMNTLLCLTGLNSITCLAITIQDKCGTFAYNQYIKILESVPEEMMNGCGELQFKDVFPTMLEIYRENQQTDKVLRGLFKTSRF